MGVNNHQNNGGRGSSNNSGNNNGNSSSDSEDDWGDESWTVDCPCGVNYDDGEEMVACDECEVWVHTSCCHVPKSLPTYVCDKCKEKEKKRKEKEESEVAQLLVDLPGKTVTFEDNRNGGLLVTPLKVVRQVHENGVPGGDSSIFVGVPGVFSQQLWKCTGYIPKLLQVQYEEVPKWQDDEQKSFSLFDPPQKRETSPKPKVIKKVKQQQEDARVTNVETETQRRKILLDIERKDKQAKRMEAMRSHAKHNKHRFRGVEKPNSHVGKRVRDDVPDGFQRKKMKTSPDAVKKGLLQSPKNPKAMKKSAVQEYMDVDVRICGKCQKPEDEQGTCGCQKLTRVRKHPETEGKPDVSRADHRKFRHGGGSTNVSPDSELSKQENQEGDMGDQSPLYKLCKAATSMKIPSDDEDKKPQLSIKTGASLKSDIPSPASINSGGPSPAKLAAEKTISKNKLLLKPALMKSSKHPTNMKRPDGKNPARMAEASTSMKDMKPKLTPQIKTCKTVMPQSKSAQAARVLKKQPATLKASGSHRDTRDESPSSPTKHDKEVALLLHQQLNSSPRVPRVPRGRQSSQAASNMSNKRTGGNLPAAQKEHRLTWRKRCRDDQSIRENCSKYGETPLLTAMNRKSEEAMKSEDGTDDTASSRTDSPESSDADEDFLAEKTSRVDQKRSSPLSDADDKEKTGFLDEVLRSKSRVSFEDAVPPHNLCKVNGERYVEESAAARSDCVTNQSVIGLKAVVSQEWCKSSTEGPSFKHYKGKRRTVGNDGINNKPTSSSDDDGSNYSDEDEEMVVRRKIKQETSEDNETD